MLCIFMSDPVTIIKSLSHLERELLPHIATGDDVDALIEKSGLGDAEVRRGLLWLENRELITSASTQTDMVDLDMFGRIAKEKGLSERRVLEKLDVHEPTLVHDLVEDDLPQPEIMSCMGPLKSIGAVIVEKNDDGLRLQATQTGKELLDQEHPAQSFLAKSFPIALDSLSEQEKQVLVDLSKRKSFIKKTQHKQLTITVTNLGYELQGMDVDFSNIIESVTPDVLKTGSWKDKEFRTLDVQSRVPPHVGGRRHPLREALNLLRDVYVGMGFQEMKGTFVETAFWNMDSMWIPQDHPARDEQDTFFIGKQGTIPQELARNVKEAHENGFNTGSTGHTKKWDPELAKQLLLRTHTTAKTFRMFGEENIQNGKYFCIDTVFRNEAIDATHLAEFYQAEGFVVGDDLTLSDLMGFIKEFYARLGIHKIRFKPTFNPYTEPSLEAHYYDEEKKKWFALINSGIFRPEALSPYGLADKTVIAWGMGASRVASILNGTTNIRELAGPTVSFDWIADHKTPQPKLD